jgi:hypothetical protein
MKSAFGFFLFLLGMMAIAGGAAEQSIVESPHGALAEDCSLCHSASSWKPLALSPAFDHAHFGLRLEGRHADLYCGFCHASLEFTGLDSGCVNCHVDAHDGELGTECEQCHGYTSFAALDDQIRMHRTSSFPLSGAHLSVSCDRCHPPSPPGTNTFLMTSSACIDCHEASFESVVEPDHTGTGFSTDCERCHAMTRWNDAHFDHSRVRGIPCVDCHQDDYDATRNPDHTLYVFSLDCADCHNTQRWGDGRFDHREFFPIYSGAHREPWNSCSDCHVDSGNLAVYACLGCHPHNNQRETDLKHSGIQDYDYTSLRCFECHPDGRS